MPVENRTTATDEKYRVRYVATFEATVSVRDGSSLAEAIADITVPQDGVSRYVDGSFLPAADQDGNLIVCDENGRSL